MSHAGLFGLSEVLRRREADLSQVPPASLRDAALGPWLRARTADRAPSVLVFSHDRLPADLLPGADGRSPLTAASDAATEWSGLVTGSACSRSTTRLWVSRSNVPPASSVGSASGLPLVSITKRAVYLSPDSVSTCHRNSRSSKASLVTVWLVRACFRKPNLSIIWFVYASNSLCGAKDFLNG